MILIYFFFNKAKRTSTKASKGFENSPKHTESAEDEELRERVLELLDLFQLEAHKNELAKQKYSSITAILQELLNFTRKIMNAYRELCSNNLTEYEENRKIFLEIRKKIPKELDPAYEEEVARALRNKANNSKKLKAKMKFIVPKLGGPKNLSKYIVKRN